MVRGSQRRERGRRPNGAGVNSPLKLFDIKNINLLVLLTFSLVNYRLWNNCMYVPIMYIKKNRNKERGS